MSLHSRTYGKEKLVERMENNIMVLLKISKDGQNQQHDLLVPQDITAKELLEAIVNGYHLDINLEDISQCYLAAENPTVLLKGNQKLEECGIHDGTIINVIR